MIVPLIFFVFIAVAVCVVVAKSIARTNDEERLVVFRLGQLYRVYPPGLALLIPFVDRGVKIKVDAIAGWQKLPEDELQQRVAQAVLDKSASR